MEGGLEGRDLDATAFLDLTDRENLKWALLLFYRFVLPTCRSWGRESANIVLIVSGISINLQNYTSNLPHFSSIPDPTFALEDKIVDKLVLIAIICVPLDQYPATCIQTKG